MTSPDDVIERLEAKIAASEATAAKFYNPGTADEQRSHVALERDCLALIKTLTQAVETEREECAKLLSVMASDAHKRANSLKDGVDAATRAGGESDALYKAIHAIRSRSTQDKT